MLKNYVSEYLDEKGNLKPKEFIKMIVKLHEDLEKRTMNANEKESFRQFFMQMPHTIPQDLNEFFINFFGDVFCNHHPIMIYIAKQLKKIQKKIGEVNIFFFF